MSASINNTHYRAPKPFVFTRQELNTLATCALELLKIAKGESKPKIKYGICLFLANYDKCGRLFDDAKSPLNLDKMFESWGYYSGDSGYPVPHPYSNWLDWLFCKKYLAREAFKDSHDKWAGKYGKLRCNLAIHIAETINAYLDEVGYHR